MKAAIVTDHLRKLRRRVMVAGALVALALGGGVVAKRVGPAPDVREIRLVARDMAYYTGEPTDPNPTLRLTRGERIRFTLTNDDPGYSHNLVAPVLGLSMPLLGHGRSQTIAVTVPDITGVFPYACGPHSEMMRGNIAIE